MSLTTILRGGALCALCVGLSHAPARAQNGTNFDVLNNGFDVILAAVGAGSTDPDGVPGTGDELIATEDGGLGYWVAGENLAGASVTAAFGDFGYRMYGWREFQCLLTPGLDTTGAGLVINYAHISMYEHVSPNANCPTCFSNPFCTSGAPGALLPSAGAGYPSSCFAMSGVPSAFGPSSLMVLIPDTTLGVSANPIYIIAAANNTYLDIPDASLGFCWVVQFNWLPSVLPLQDDIEGLWSYRLNSPDLNQYWGMSNDEVNLWNSNTWFGFHFEVFGIPVWIGSPPTANQDYAGHLISRDASTHAALAPAGFNGAANTFYAGPIPNGAAVPGSIFDLNQGFDIGRGADAIAFSGTGGAAGPNGNGNQNIANNPPNSLGVGGNATTLGFSSFSNFGSTVLARVVFGSIDLEGALCVPSGTVVPDLAKGNFRIPFNTAGFVTFGPTINGLLGTLFGHTAEPGYFDPDFTADVFGLGIRGGHSIHLPVSAQAGACTGLPVNITYGSLALKTNGKLNFETCASGRRQLFLMF